MAARQITVNLVSDTKAFQRSMQDATTSTGKFQSAMKDTATQGDKFGTAIGSVEGGLGKATNGFRSSADLAGGLAGVFGVSLGPMEQYATGLADMADGMGGLLGPALTKGKDAFGALNSTMRANPILTVVAVIALLVAAFVVAYKNSETFRNIVAKVGETVAAVFTKVKDTVATAAAWIGEKFGWVGKAIGESVGAWWDLIGGVFGRIRNVVSTVVGGIKTAFENVADPIKGVFEGIASTIKSVFNGIASVWNNGPGRLSFSIPGWVPGIGGKGFDVPDIPMLAAGGRATGGMPHIVGERGPELFVPGMSGTVVPNHKMGGTTRVVFDVTGADREMKALIQRMVRMDGGVERAFGR